MFFPKKFVYYIYSFYFLRVFSQVFVYRVYDWCLQRSEDSFWHLLLEETTVWVLGIEPRTSARSTSALDLYGISPAPLVCLLPPAAQCTCCSSKIILSSLLKVITPVLFLVKIILNNLCLSTSIYFWNDIFFTNLQLRQSLH